MALSTASPICFGNVVKLVTDDNKSMGFLEHKIGKNGKNNKNSENSELLLVMGPVKDSAKDKFQEAQFIVAPIRCEKPPANNTPLKYKQPFVLMTSSQFEAYSLNNKMYSEDTIGLQCRDVKGEMYVAFEKEGYTMEANVMDNDSALDLVVVDSNRMRKNYNKKLAVQIKSKSLALGGYVTCGSKGKPLNLRVELVQNAERTPNFAKTKIERRRSTLTKEEMVKMAKEEATKEDEVARANRVNSDGSEPGMQTPTDAASPVAATKQETVDGGESAPGATDATPNQSPDAVPTSAPVDHVTPAPTSTASTTESTASTSKPTPVGTATAVAAAAAVPTTTTTTATKTASETAEVPATGAALEEKTEAAASHGGVETGAEKVTKETTKSEDADVKTAASATPSSTPGPTPQAAAFAIPQSPKKLGEQQQSSLTLTSEAEGGEEKLDSNCLGENKCAIM